VDSQWMPNPPAPAPGQPASSEPAAPGPPAAEQTPAGPPFFEQAPAGQPAFGQPPFAPPPARASRRPLVAVGVAGLLVGAVVVGSLWLGTVLSGGGTGSDDVSDACDILGRLPALTQATYQAPYVHRVEAATALASAAAAGDSRYQQLARDTTAAYQALITYDVDGVNQQIKASVADCKAL
jgi:hypothetical protein